MQALPVNMVRLEFAKRAEWRREDERRILDHNKAEKERRRQRDERDAEQAILDDIVIAVLASETDIADFTVKLDAYDTATVEALQANEEALARVRDELRIMREKAFVLPDGRKVFKTEDGTRLFDESGTEVKNVDPASVEDWRPKAEDFFGLVEKRDALTEERRQLHDYQAELDSARERVGEDGLTKDEPDDLERRLEGDMPEMVKRHLFGNEATSLDKANQKEPQNVPFHLGAKLDMPSL